MEGVNILLAALVSFVVYLPVRVIPPVKFCIPFVLVFLGKDQDELAIAAAIILSILLLVVLLGLIIIGYDTQLFKRDTDRLRRIVELSSGDLYLQALQKRNPDRKLIYYGVGLFLQYVFISSVQNLTSDSTPPKFCVWLLRTD